MSQQSPIPNHQYPITKMNLNQLLTDLSNKGIKLWLEGDQLRLGAPKGTLSKELGIYHI